MTKTIQIPVPDDVADGEIIRSLVGSTLYGTGEPGGEDTDYMGVCVEPINTLLGLGQFDQWVWRTQPEGQRSGPGDIDITIYGLRKYLALATKGNPSMLILLFTPERYLTVQTSLGVGLQALAPAIISKQVAAPFMGYCKAQRERLEDVRGGRHTNRPELIEKFGYDTKYAMHALRLAYQGQEILKTGRIELPIPNPEGDILRAVRTGQVAYGDFMTLLEIEEAKLVRLADNNSLPEKPLIKAIEVFMRQARLEVWQPINLQQGDTNE